ncbi:sarcosine oxidase subunit gamma [Rhodobacterales bacterium HKCCSP123]|nr:sarcosine oxidase subunit gamma [Rhodobacterales bacterium HKCCSP123]
MAELIAKSPARGLTPVEAGGVTLTEAPMGPIWAVMPYRGKGAALSAALEAAHGLGFPAPGLLAETGDARIAWSGLDQAFLMGVMPDRALAAHAALTDQSDAWTHLVLEGAAVRDVLARWMPVELSPSACPPGSARRSLVGHMTALVLHPGGDRFEILVFRSMAATAIHELTRSMRAVAARREL